MTNSPKSPEGTSEQEPPPSDEKLKEILVQANEDRVIDTRTRSELTDGLGMGGDPWIRKQLELIFKHQGNIVLFKPMLRQLEIDWNRRRKPSVEM